MPVESGATPASRDGKVKDVYPWGNQWPPPNNAGNYGPSLGVDTFEKTSPVGSFRANKFGLFDMGGNVWRWCEDVYDGGTEGPRALRGGSWYFSDPDFLLSSRRRASTTSGRRDDFGFRCVLATGTAQ